MKTFKPKGTWVLVDIIEAGKTKGGIELPETSNIGVQYIVAGKGEAVEKKINIGDSLFAVGKVFSLSEVVGLPKGQGLIPEEAILGVIE
jgi:hypothetical protein